ncbi:hypothetical protein COY45_00420 [Candidatus Berkelbacteria bacterium CG_4_10_14_0_8_um_filter_42_34]|uniref:Secreted protein n=1 Tax=Candidatus Berkelbacteria bacterium CG_4_10_14_0_8_um_filter_42_34 TaxID=1974502 RepID=A0A2M7SXC4_9BACT|nr:MAG: hypothetical protein COY45_00420 [Candidatus Berkelbacteria bacterium CG_4_10_14_0_8_um_filter_42_34]
MFLLFRKLRLLLIPTVIYSQCNAIAIAMTATAAVATTKLPSAERAMYYCLQIDRKAWRVFILLIF